MEEKEKVVVAPLKYKNIVDEIKRLLFNYDMAIVEVNGEIDLLDFEIDKIKTIDEKLSARNKKKIIILQANKQVYQNFLNELVKKRQKITCGIDLILERFKNPDIAKIIFYEYMLKEESKENLLKLYKIHKQDFEMYLEHIKSLLITTYKY